MDSQPASLSPDPAAFALIQQKLAYEAKIRNGLNWFYWIAALSLLNSVIYLVGGSLNFVVGLGATQFIDGLMAGLAIEFDAGLLPRLIGFGLDVVLAAVFAAAGYLGRQRQRWAVVAGLGLYALDALIFVWVSEWLAVAFHAFALVGLWQGLQALTGLKHLEANGPIVVPAGLAPPPLPTPRRTSGSPQTFQIFVIVVVVVAVCLLVPVVAMVFFPALLQ